MSAGSGPSCGLLSGSDPVESIEQENGVPGDDARNSIYLRRHSLTRRPPSDI
jgi:hypothetical protein